MLISCWVIITIKVQYKKNTLRRNNLQMMVLFPFIQGLADLASLQTEISSRLLVSTYTHV